MVDLETPWTEIVAAYCRWVTTRLPSGELGAATAVDVLDAFPEVCRRALPDVTVSAPEFFSLLVSLGIRTSTPSDRTMPAALRLVAGACPLIAPRSPRRFTAWFGAAGDPASSLAAELRARVTPSMLLARAELPPRPAPARLSVRADRDRLAAALREMEVELAQGRAREADLDARRLAAEEKVDEVERCTRAAEERHRAERTRAREDAERRLLEAEGARRRAEAEVSEQRQAVVSARAEVSSIRAENERRSAAEADARALMKESDLENRRLRGHLREAQAELRSSATKWSSIAADYEARIERERALVAEHAQAIASASSDAEELRRKLDVEGKHASARARAEARSRDLEAQLSAANLELEGSRRALMLIRDWVSAEPGEEAAAVREVVLRSRVLDQTIEELEEERDGAQEELAQERSRRE